MSQELLSSWLNSSSCICFFACSSEKSIEYLLCITVCQRIAVFKRVEVLVLNLYSFSADEITT